MRLFLRSIDGLGVGREMLMCPCCYLEVVLLLLEVCTLLRPVALGCLIRVMVLMS
jgi:hypothetical protein